MIRYQLSTTIREIVALRTRALLLVSLVVIINLSLPYTLNDAMKGLSNLRTASVVAEGDVTYFSLFYNDTMPPSVNDEVNDLMSRVLDGESLNYSIVKYNFFYDPGIESQVVVAFGGFSDVYGLPARGSDHDVVLVGADVVGYEVGEVIDFGDISAPVAGRTPRGVSYLDPWSGDESLDDVVLLLTTYSRFADAVPPDVWQQEAVGRTLLFNATDRLVTEFVGAAASTGGIGLVPQNLESRVSRVYQAQVERSTMFLVFFACLLAVLAVTLVLTLDSLVAGNVRRHAIERLYGADLVHLLGRANLFVLLTFSLPVLVIFGGFAMLVDTIASVFPVVVAVVVVVQLLLTLRAIVELRRSSLINQLRQE